MPPEKAFVNIDKYGNTSAASIPIALDEAWRAGKLVAGRRHHLRRVRRGADLGQRGRQNLTDQQFGGTGVLPMMRSSTATDTLESPSRTLTLMTANQLTSSVPARVPRSSAWARTSTTRLRRARDVSRPPTACWGSTWPSVCFDGPEERLNQTDISQPAIYVTERRQLPRRREAGVIDPDGRHGLRGAEPGRIHGPAPGGRVRLRRRAEAGRRPRPLHAGGRRRVAQRHGRDHRRGSKQAVSALCRAVRRGRSAGAGELQRARADRRQRIATAPASGC